MRNINVRFQYVLGFSSNASHTVKYWRVFHVLPKREIAYVVPCKTSNRDYTKNIEKFKYF